MYAVVETGGKQQRVEVGSVVRIERVPGEVGSEVVFDRVLLLAGDDDNIKVGAPTLEGIRVRGTVLEHGRHDKIRIFTFKRRKNSNRRTLGHRQGFSAVRIDAIEA